MRPTVERFGLRGRGSRVCGGRLDSERWLSSGGLIGDSLGHVRLAGLGLVWSGWMKW